MIKSPHMRWESTRCPSAGRDGYTSNSTRGIITKDGRRKKNKSSIDRINDSSLFSLFFVAYISTCRRKKVVDAVHSFEKCPVKSSMARLRALMTFKFGEVASFVVKENSYYALPSASTSRKYKGQNVVSMLISPGGCR